MKISIVTAVYNRARTIQDTFDSVRQQTYTDIEYVVVDGDSNDGTDKIVDANAPYISKSIREPDHGIYDALNKGIAAAQGDVVGFLHADDMLADAHAIEWVATAFDDANIDAVYGDLVYVDAGRPDEIVRYWESGPYSSEKFRWGWMPPHPTFYVKKSVYECFGKYRTDFGSGADYECLLRLCLKHKIRVAYIPQVLVKMRRGGASNVSLSSRLAANRLDRQAWLANGITPPLGLRFIKPMSKLLQYFSRPKS